MYPSPAVRKANCLLSSVPMLCPAMAAPIGFGQMNKCVSSLGKASARLSANAGAYVITVLTNALAGDLPKLSKWIGTVSGSPTLKWRYHVLLFSLGTSGDTQARESA